MRAFHYSIICSIKESSWRFVRVAEIWTISMFFPGGYPGAGYPGAGYPGAPPPAGFNPPPYGNPGGTLSSIFFGV